jgi:L-threonylcarbamoyladenylate synthase
MRLAFNVPLTASLTRAHMARPPTSRPAPRATLIWRGDSADDVRAAGAAIAAGKLVAFPTETVYGLGANANDADAVRAVFVAKGRPPDNPLIVHVANVAALATARLTKMPLQPIATAVTAAFWPGPLTLVLPRLPESDICTLVTAGLDSVAVRVPRHPVAIALLAEAGVPVAAPSANSSGRPSPTGPEHVFADLDGRIDGILDAGLQSNEAILSNWGVESTVVDLTDEKNPTILRPGVISASDLERVSGVRFRIHSPRASQPANAVSSLPSPSVVDCGGVDAPQTGALEALEHNTYRRDAPKAPGMKYRHYAPHSPVFLCNPGEVVNMIRKHLASPGASDARQAVGLMADAETCAEAKSELAGENIAYVSCGVRGDVASVARSLYGSLRAFDGEGQYAVPPPGVRVIVAVAFENADDGIAGAVMNRLRKAASAPVGGGL